MIEIILGISGVLFFLLYFDGFGNGPVVNSFYLPLVHGYSSFVDDVPKELDFRLVELTLLILGGEIELESWINFLSHRMKQVAAAETCESLSVGDD